MEKLNLNDLKVAIDDFKKAAELISSVQDTLDVACFSFYSDVPSEIHFVFEKDLINIAKTCHKTVRIKQSNDILTTAYFTYRGVTFLSNTVTATGKKILLEAGAIEEEPKGENA